MIYIEINKQYSDSFMVVDKKDDPVTGLTQSNFTVKLFNPSKQQVANISTGVSVDIEEVGNGLYRVSFIPETLGNWDLIIYNATYFPYGKGENYICVNSLAGDVTKDLVERVLGLCQDNYKITDQDYDKNNNMTGAIIKIYPSATDLENDTNLKYQYEMTAVFNNKNHLTGYTFKRVL